MHRRVLVAPLNWGLGHATRCIPLIRHALVQGHHVVLASDGRAGALLQKEFPQCPYHELPGYQIRYPQKAMIWHWLTELPSLSRRIRQENHALESIIASEGIDRILSDNRYGIFHATIPSVILTHQLTIQLPLLKSISARLLGHLVNRFHECWIPDEEPPNALTGKLSQSAFVKIPIRRIGHLSRFSKRDVDKDISYTAVVSGPEPDRTRFEELLRIQLDSMPGQKYLVTGQTDSLPDAEELDGNFTVLHAPSSDLLEDLMARSHWIICRAGYSSIMDLLFIGNRAILVPTPRQPEQQYLAQSLLKHPQFQIQKEEELDLGAESRENFQVYENTVVSDSYGTHLDNFLS